MPGIGPGAGRGEGGPGHRPGRQMAIADVGGGVLVGPGLHQELDGGAHRDQQKVHRRRCCRGEAMTAMGEMRPLVCEDHLRSATTGSRL
jgi:hypothetical protein